MIYQGEYTVISNWIKEGGEDFGFVNSDAKRVLPIASRYFIDLIIERFIKKEQELPF